MRCLWFWGDFGQPVLMWEIILNEGPGRGREDLNEASTRYLDP